MAIEVKRHTEIVISGESLRVLVAMANVVLELILDGKGNVLGEDRPDVRRLAEFLISVGCKYEEY